MRRLALAFVCLLAAVVFVACDSGTGPAANVDHDSARLKAKIRCTGDSDSVSDVAFQISKDGGPWLKVEGGVTVTNTGGPLADPVDCNEATPFIDVQKGVSVDAGASYRYRLTAVLSSDGQRYCVQSRDDERGPWVCASPEPAGTVYDSFDTPAVPATEPPAIAEQGYTKVFEDNFDTFNTSVWTNDIWFQNDDPAGAKFVQDGVLNLVSRRSQGFPGIHTTTLGRRSWTRGYFEIRMRWQAVAGSFPGMFIMSSGWASGPTAGTCATPAAELDVVEGQGTEPFRYYGTTHRHSGPHVANCGLVEQRNVHVNWPTRLADNWHTYAVRWTTNQLCFYVDDTQAGCVAPYDTLDEAPLFMILQQDIGGWAAGNTPAATTNELRAEYDWVRVWQR